MKFSVKLAFFSLVIFTSSISAVAQQRDIPEGAAVIKLFDKDGIDKWASCSWNKMPVTAQNLIDHQSYERKIEDLRKIPFSSPDENLNARLNAVCGKFMAPSDRNSVSFGVQRAKKIALNENRPEQPGTNDQKIKLYVCAHKILGRYAITERNLEKPKAKRKLAGSITDCFKIESDGSLSDA